MAGIGTMIIDGEVLEVSRAVLRGNLLGGEFYWDLVVGARGTIDDDDVEPSAYSVNLLAWRNRVIARMDDLIGEEIRWDDAYDAASGNTHGGICLYGHKDILNSKLKLLKGEDGLRLEWNAIADLDLSDDRESDEYALSIDAALTFEGYVLHGYGPEKAFSRIREFVTEEELLPPEPWVNDSVLLRPAES
ncbi:MAG: hypothetical protein EOP83_25120 [Verrucomicrobiaceae bacterium]|nr:MAG: hypothetical protein EOP83_25120 [Verrucomicrobiaceae bacterium]